MSTRALWVCGPLLAAGVMVLACGGTTRDATDGGGEASSSSSSGGSSGSGSGGSSGSSSGGGPDASIPPHGPAKNVDLLFMIDNSASMGDKQSLLGLAIPVLIQRLVTPDCVDGSGNPIAGVVSDASGNCAMGKPEFAPVTDLHIGIVTSSLGGRGGDQCPDSIPNPANPALDAHQNDKGELVNRGGVRGDPTVENPMPDETPPDNFLAYYPGSSNPPPNAVTNPTTLISEFSTAVLGVHEHGCGFEAQNEAWYRFLVQPDPFDTINVGGAAAKLQGVDATLLKQRADFLRPDSLLAVVVVTDENEEVADPLGLGGQGWAFENTSFPGSPNMAAPEGTIECNKLDPMNPSKTGPNDPNCTSCAFVKNDPNFAARCPNDPPGGTGGYYDPMNDALNVRFFHQKMRFGITAAYPTSRYVRGLQRTTVPSVGLASPGDTDHEHDAKGNYVGDQDANANCVNPIYAKNLPTSASGDLCHLTPGPRTPDMVYYAAIAGVPHQLLQQDPTNPMSPQKATLSAADWKRIMGNDPEHYDFSGADFHMIESTQDRTTSTTDPTSSVWANHSTCPSGSADDCDPINGREFATNKSDLQFSCIFPLVTVDPTSNDVVAFQKDCTTPGAGDKYKGACDCATGALDANTPLCQPAGGGMYSQVQIHGKAYPSVREMIIAHAMATSSAGVQGFVSSVCPIAVDIGQPLSTAQQDPLFGYNPGINAIVEGIKKSFQPYP